MCLSSAVIASKVRTASLQPLRLQQMFLVDVMEDTPPASDGGHTPTTDGGHAPTTDGGHAPSNRWRTRPQRALMSHSAVTPPVRSDEFDSFQEFLLGVFKPDLNRVFSASTSQSRGGGVNGGRGVCEVDRAADCLALDADCTAICGADPPAAQPQWRPEQPLRPPFDFANEFSGGCRASVYVALSAFVR